MKLEDSKDSIYNENMQLKSLFLAIYVVFFSMSAFAEKEIVFHKQTQVYSEKDLNSAVIGVYEKGDAIPISKIKYGQWRKVIAEVDGKQRIGWVYLKDIVGSHIKDKEEVLKARGGDNSEIIYHHKQGIGIFGSLAYTYQTGGTLNGSTSTGLSLSAKYSTVKGSNIYAGIFGDFNLSSTKTIRVYLAQRDMQRSGSATINSSSSASSFEISQSTLALGTTLKFYSAPYAIFWWGPGIEIDKTTKNSISGTVSGATFSGDATSKPTYFMGTLSAGYDFPLFKNFFILPQVQFGIAPTSPMITTLEVLIPVSYNF